MKDQEILRQMGVVRDAPILVRETEWSRTYTVGPKAIYYESKFLADMLQVNADALIERWPTITPSERHDFARAFQSKPTISREDEKLLEFLAEAGDETIWTTIALMFCRHRNREVACNFVLTRIQKSRGSLTNYYQAAELLADANFETVLQSHFLRDARKLEDHPGANEQMPLRWYLQFLQLCSTLSTLTGDTSYRNAIAKFLHHPSELLRRRAENHLRQTTGDTSS